MLLLCETVLQFAAGGRKGDARAAAAAGRLPLTGAARRVIQASSDQHRRRREAAMPDASTPRTTCLPL
eukprot:794812-Rhodomonas_salina.1